tara:strand:- start:1039 stop:1272 length:234 start_codon:yes stop_codon:yes gene_type:complete
MKIYELTDEERASLTALWADTHNLGNAIALDAFYGKLLNEKYTHTTDIDPNSIFALGTIEITKGFVNATSMVINNKY